MLVDERVGVIPMTEFEGHKPFQYRVLMPVLIRTIEFITPRFIVDRINGITADFVNTRLRTRADLPDYKTDKLSQYGCRVIVFLILNTLTLFGFLIILRQMAKALNIFSERVCDLLPLGMAIVIPIYFNFGNFMYDFSHLLLFASSLLLLYKKQWRFYLVLYSLALLNKETSVMLAIVFIVNYYKELRRAEFYKLLGIQAGLFMIIKLSLYLTFIDNPGGVVEHHLAWNLNHLSQLSSYFNFEPIGKGMIFPAYLNIPLPRGINLPMIGFMVFIIIYKWKDIPLFLRRSLVYVPVLFAFGLFMGHINELRSYYAALPVVYLSVMAGIVKFIESLKLERIE